MVYSGLKMKAAILYEQNKPLVIEEIIIPELKEGQVLVKIFATGLCHTQLNEMKGKKGPDKHLPHTLGHEGSGIIEAVGANVSKVKKGDHVVLSWIKGLGINSDAPIYYNDSGTKINSGQLSTFNEYTVTAENRVTPIKKEMPLDLAALLGCAVATGMGAITNDAKLKKNDSVVVFGAGGIGLSVVQAASINNASKILAVDINDAKLERAKDLGATHLINAAKCDVVETVKKITDNKGVDFAIESAGLSITMEQAFQTVKISGGKAILIGNLSHKQKISIDPFALICGKQIVGSWGGGTDPDKDFPYYVNLFLTGKLQLDKMLTHRFNVNEINEAFVKLENGEVGRAIIVFGDGE